MVVEFLKALIYGIVEGVTEWLPISSTGHLILFADLLPFAFTQNAELLAEFWEMFEVVIQLGAILAVLVLFWERLLPIGKDTSPRAKMRIWQTWKKVLVASVPAGVIGFFGETVLKKTTGKDVDGWLYHAVVVAVALIVYGIAFIVVEHFGKEKTPQINGIREISYRTAFFIGLFQALSLIPGTSRSGSTILGALLLGVSHPVATEFSFFMAIPIMLGASGMKAIEFVSYMLSSGVSVPGEAWMLLLVGCMASFLVSMLVIRFLTDFVKRHNFVPFGVYRILLGIGVLVAFFLK